HAAPALGSWQCASYMEGRMLSPEDFSGKTLRQRVALLIAGPAGWMVMISVIAFLTTITVTFAQYSRRQAVEAYQSAVAETRLQITKLAESMANTTADIVKTSTQIPDDRLRTEILSKTLLLQKQLLELSILYRDLERRSDRLASSDGTSREETDVVNGI